MAERASARVLLVDDDLAIAKLIQHLLGKNGFPPARHVTTGREALTSLDDVDFVLLDHQLPDASGLDVLDAIRARSNPPAVIVVTAHGNESLAAAALRRGADDYLAKDASLSDLLPQILERVRNNREIRKALVAAEQDLVRAERLAAIGEMTVTLHHEINNPLMSAFTDIELILADPHIAADHRPGLEAIRDSLRRIRDIVRQISDLRQTRTREYLPGMKMLDLGDAADPAGKAPHRGPALVYVPDEDVARVVALLLRDAGFEVRRYTGVGELQAAAGTVGVSLVVVAGGAGALGAHPLAGFVPSPLRDYRVVALATGDGVAARGAGADCILPLPFDPSKFTAEVVELVRRA
jgi:DNA-binding response OmpR family regulator